jgi:hypothetical protein
MGGGFAVYAEKRANTAMGRLCLEVRITAGEWPKSDIAW